MAVLCGGPCGGQVLPLAGCDCSSCPLQLVLAGGQVSWEVVGSLPVPSDPPDHLLQPGSTKIQLTLMVLGLVALKGKRLPTVTVNSGPAGQGHGFRVVWVVVSRFCFTYIKGGQIFLCREF